MEYLARIPLLYTMFAAAYAAGALAMMRIADRPKHNRSALAVTIVVVFWPLFFLAWIGFRMVFRKRIDEHEEVMKCHSAETSVPLQRSGMNNIL